MYWSADATREALKAMAGQGSLPALLCGASSPSVHATTREGEAEQGGVGDGEVHVCDVCVCVCVCACSSAYFFRPNIFTVQRFFSLC